MTDIKFKKIIRICRTWPTNGKRSIGLHAYYYTKYINIPTEIFLKDDLKNKSLLNLKNANFKLIKYKDLKFNLKKPNLFYYFIISCSKLIGESIMFINLISNIGFGPEATWTLKSKNDKVKKPKKLKNFRFKSKEVTRNVFYDNQVFLKHFKGNRQSVIMKTKDHINLLISDPKTFFLKAKRNLKNV